MEVEDEEQRGVRHVVDDIPGRLTIEELADAEEDRPHQEPNNEGDIVEGPFQLAQGDHRYREDGSQCDLEGLFYGRGAGLCVMLNYLSRLGVPEDSQVQSDGYT